MKISINQLRKIIKEEVTKIMETDDFSKPQFVDIDGKYPCDVCGKMFWASPLDEKPTVTVCPKCSGITPKPHEVIDAFEKLGGAEVNIDDLTAELGVDSDQIDWDETGLEWDVESGTVYPVQNPAGR